MSRPRDRCDRGEAQCRRPSATFCHSPFHPFRGALCAFGEDVPMGCRDRRSADPRRAHPKRVPTRSETRRTHRLGRRALRLGFGIADDRHSTGTSSTSPVADDLVAAGSMTAVCRPFPQNNTQAELTEHRRDHAEHNGIRRSRESKRPIPTPLSPATKLSPTTRLSPTHRVGRPPSGSGITPQGWQPSSSRPVEHTRLVLAYLTGSRSGT
jgi:hypothetical protein